MATKTETIAIKVSPAEKEYIQRLAAKEDITVSKLLYRMIFKGGLLDAYNSSELENNNH